MIVEICRWCEEQPARERSYFCGDPCETLWGQAVARGELVWLGPRPASGVSDRPRRRLTGREPGALPEVPELPEATYGC